MSWDYGRALKECSIKDGILRAPDCDYKLLTDKLRFDLLSNAVPHYKPIGLLVESVTNTDFVTKINKLGKTYTELFTKVKDVVPIHKGGITISTKDTESFFNYYYEDCGIIYSLGNSNTYEETFKYSGESTIADFLVNDVDIFNVNNIVVFSILYKRGVGMMDFYDTQNFIAEGYDKYRNYKPIRAVYDLNDYISVGIYDQANDGVRLYYKRDVNEKGFETILHDYGDDLLNQQ